MRRDDANTARRSVRTWPILGDDQAAAAVRRVAKCSGPGRYALRQWTPQTKESRVQRQALSVERLRLRTALLQRLA